MTWLPALGVALLLTLVAALENTVAPWAPFYVVYAALALGVPLLLGRADLGNLRRPRLWHWLAAVALPIALQALFRLITAGAELPGMFERVFTTAGGRLTRVGDQPAPIGRAHDAELHRHHGLVPPVALGPSLSLGKRPHRHRAVQAHDMQSIGACEAISLMIG